VICGDCTRAGKYNAKGEQGFAAQCHRDCQGGCDCQHKTGKWINQRGDK
jgi:hypothetical protein